MKKILFYFIFFASSLEINSQPSSTIAVQFFIDSDGNCVYNTGDQLIHNVSFNFTYINSSGASVNISISGGSVSSGCSAFTIGVNNPSITATNTLNLIPNYGLLPNLSCTSFTNIQYNTNSVHFLPLNGNIPSMGVQMICNYYSTSGTYTYGNVMINNKPVGACSNMINDSIELNFRVNNYLNCNNTATVSTRTYSLFLDGVNYDQLICTGQFGTNTVGVNNMSKITEQYLNTNAQIQIQPQLPITFTNLGSHTLEVKSSSIYNHSLSVISFSCILNSVPCSQIGGRFFIDCNNNCILDGSDSYGVGWNATGRIYNNNGFNVLFHPNPSDGRFSINVPSNIGYLLTQYPTNLNSYLACITTTQTIPISASTNSLLYGYKNSTVVAADPSVYLSRLASTSVSISPFVGITFGVVLLNSSWNVCNNGPVNPGYIKVTIPKFINYISSLSGPSPTFITGGSKDTLIWAVPNFSNVVNWWNNVYATFSVVVSATAVPGTSFNIQTTLSPTIDNNYLNNSYNWNGIIGGPFDPNLKTTEAAGLKENGDVPFGTQQFYYKIGFQNVGNAPAFNVKTLDTIDANFDLNSLEILQSSYPVNTQIDIVSRAVLFNFDGINLIDANTNEPASHGFVRYGVKLKPGVNINTVLKNRAHNYFDFNEPVSTNQTNNKLINITSIQSIEHAPNVLEAIPNPFNNLLKLQSQKTIERIQVYNLIGELKIDIESSSNVVNLNLENLPSTVYILKIKFEDNSITNVKVIKQ